MIVLLQRVKEGAVEVDGRTTGRVGVGFVALVCAEPGDTPERIAKAARKTARLRVFADDAGRMNRSVADVAGGVLAVPQFTLAADCMSGNRPSFTRGSTPSSRRCAPRACPSRRASSAPTWPFRSSTTGRPLSGFSFDHGGDSP